MKTTLTTPESTRPYHPRSGAWDLICDEYRLITPPQVFRAQAQPTMDEQEG